MTTRHQSLFNQTTLFALGLDEAPPVQPLARLMNQMLGTRYLVYVAGGVLVVRKENTSQEMEVVFDTAAGAALQNVCQWFVEELKAQTGTRKQKP
jgi:hypothetical protein